MTRIIFLISVLGEPFIFFLTTQWLFLKHMKSWPWTNVSDRQWIYEQCAILSWFLSFFFLSSPCEHAARKPTHGHLALTSAFLEFFFFLVCVYSL